VGAGRRRWNLNIHYHRVVLEALPAGATTALDVGSGDGLLAFDLADRGLQVVGIDPHERSVERARSDAACSDRATFVCGEVFTHPFEPGSFDAVASIAMLHHVDAVAGLRRMAELVRPGGVVAVLGFATPSGPIDRAYNLAGYVVRIAAAALGRHWDHNAPIVWPPPHTMDEMRTRVEAEMPGARFRRGLASRCSIVWTRPPAPLAAADR
jgi:2-polyprenyl-3-methyl-5-hydroxy-6-metoxy-1,4-benzoquinol methylase